MAWGSINVWLSISYATGQVHTLSMSLFHFGKTEKKPDVGKNSHIDATLTFFPSLLQTTLGVLSRLLKFVVIIWLVPPENSLERQSQERSIHQQQPETVTSAKWPISLNTFWIALKTGLVRAHLLLYFFHFCFFTQQDKLTATKLKVIHKIVTAI